MSYRKPVLGGIDILLIVIALVGCFYHFITRGFGGHDTNVAAKVESSISYATPAILYETLPPSSYEIVASRDLFQPLYSPPEKLIVSQPKIEKPLAKVEKEVKPTQDQKIDVDVIVTGIVNDGRRIYVLVENPKSRETRFVALGESIYGLKLVEIHPRVVTFDAEGQKVEIALGRTSLNNESRLARSGGVR